MNLQRLFELQRQLDERIVKEHRLEGQDLLPKKILALQVELGELANCWRGFKFWSKDQEPRYEKVEIKVHGYDGPGPDTRASIEQYQTYPLLEEYVDCLHFILSIGNELNVNMLELEEEQYFTEEDEIETFIVINNYVTDLYFQKTRGCYREVDYQAVFWGLIGLGERFLGFTWEQIEQAYLEKNEVNHARQENGY